jgi:hypothetical protein
MRLRGSNMAAEGEDCCRFYILLQIPRYFF